METDSTPRLTQIDPPPLPDHCRSPADRRVWSTPPPIADKLSESASPLCIEARPRQSDQHRAFRVWIGSVTSHGLLLVVFWFLLAPVNLGGVGVLTIVLRLAEEDQEVLQFDPIVTSIEAVSASDAAPVEPLPLVPVAPLQTAPSTDPDAAAVENPDQPLHGDAAQGSAQGGSFFGIEADGHEFVYIVDMSGSMRGRRYRRATSELVRSVRGLRESQRFYVLLFSNNTVQMFGKSQSHPETIPATEENKANLESWLQTAYRGGGTDPRDSLRVALRMRPSAIFMLSDGEFDTPAKSKKSLLGNNVDAFSVIAAATEQTPVHAIAFEDERSRANMKRIASMTNGTYRFTKFDTEEDAQVMLAHARAAHARGDRETAARHMQDVIEFAGTTPSGQAARREYLQWLDESAAAALRRGQVKSAAQTLAEMAEIDPEAEFTADQQQQLIDALINPPSGSADHTATLAMLSEVVDRSPKSKAAAQILAPLAQQHFDEARQLAGAGKPADALRELEVVLNKYGRASAAKPCAALHKEIADRMMRRFDKLRTANDDRTAAEYVCSLVDQLRGTNVEPWAKQAAEQLAHEMLIKLRDARAQGDRETADRIDEQINQGFASHQIFRRINSRLMRSEARARTILRQASQYERLGKTDRAIDQYDLILRDHPVSLAAPKARDRLSSLRYEPPQSDNEQLLEMMLAQ